MNLEVCRICAGAQQLKNIFDQDTELIDKLLICANINVHPGDPLPKLICAQCDKNLDLCYSLRKQSEATQKRFMLEMQRKLTYQDSGNTQSAIADTVGEHKDYINDSARKSIEQNIGDHLVYEQVDLSQLSDDSIENENMDANCSKKEFLDNETSCGRIGLSAVAKQEVCGNTIKEVVETPLASEHCSIELLSSESSISEWCENTENGGTINTLTDGSILTCYTCNEVFTEIQEYRNHIKQHGLERYQCIQCCKFFPSRFRLKRHEETHKEIAFEQCPYCNRNYRALYNLERHIKSVHLGKKSWKCNLCDISFARLDVLKRHMQLHSDEKNFKCSVCSQSFKTRDYLYAHHRAHHTSNSNISKTKKRPKKENTSKNQCGYCGKIFKSAFTYKNHLLIHTNEKPHKCDSCHKHFRTIAALTTHQRIHEDYRPYQCDLCLKSFRQTSHLKEHKMLHSDNAAKHVCPICQASFAKKSNLKAHMGVHANEKPFKCADCSAEFSFMHLLQRHASKVHCRSVHKVYTLNDIDDRLESDVEVDNNAEMSTEAYHFINTVTDDNDEIDKIAENTMDSTSDAAGIFEAPSPDVEVITESQMGQNNIYDNNYYARDSEPVVDYGEMHSLNFTHSQLSDEDFVEQIEDCENLIKEEKVDILVTEETKLSISVYNTYEMEQCK